MYGKPSIIDYQQRKFYYTSHWKRNAKITNKTCSYYNTASRLHNDEKMAIKYNGTWTTKTNLEKLHQRILITVNCKFSNFQISSIADSTTKKARSQ